MTVQIRRLSLLIFILIIGLVLGLFPADTGRVYAHASLVKAAPEADAELAQAPQQIVLTFNERLEEGLNWIRVYDSSKRKVTEQAAVMNAEHTAVTLDLPQLAKGTYLVTYHIISADGHPVDESYLFAVGESLQKPADSTAPHLEHLHRTEGPFNRFGMKDIVQFGTRIAFYLSMLTLTGWILWYRWFGSRSTDEARELLKGWGERVQQAYLIVYILFMWAHLVDLIGDGGAAAFLQLFTQTTVGYAWLGGLLLALASFVLLYRWAWLDYAWVAAVWLAKALLGHASAFEPKSETLTLDWLHLFAASVWTGGLVMLLLLWRKQREQALQLYPSFSLAALLSILLLIVSGSLSVLLFLPDVRYVVETTWGKLLIAKMVLVLLVVVTAWLVRSALNKSSNSAGLLLRVDITWMLLIVGIVGVFTYLTPLPANTPLNWHVMGDKIHMTTQITPNAPGVNDFTVKVWLPEKLGKPKQVIVKLQQENGSDIAPIEVPVEPYVDQAFDESYGMTKYSYKARGSYMPYPGTWKIEVRVMDSNDDETVYDKEIKIY